MDANFDKYKSHLKQYLHQKNVDMSKNPPHCFNTSGHKNGDANPSLQIWDDGFKCYGCGIGGDIYDAVEILEGITDKKEQYDFVEKFCGGATVKPIEPYKSVWGNEAEDFKPDTLAMQEFENYLKKNAAAKEQVNNHHQRWWLEWQAPIRGLKTFLGFAAFRLVPISCFDSKRRVSYPCAYT